MPLQTWINIKVYLRKNRKLHVEDLNFYVSSVIFITKMNLPILQTLKLIKKFKLHIHTYSRKTDVFDTVW